MQWELDGGDRGFCACPNYLYLGTNDNDCPPKLHINPRPSWTATAKLPPGCDRTSGFISMIEAGPTSPITSLSTPTGTSTRDGR